MEFDFFLNFPQLFQRFIHRIFDFERIFLLHGGRLGTKIFLAQQRVLGPGGACAAKGLRTRSSVRGEGPSDPERRSWRRILGFGLAFAAKGLRNWSSVRGEEPSDLERRGSESLRVERSGRRQGYSSEYHAKAPRLGT